MARTILVLLAFALLSSAQDAANFNIAGHVVRHLDQRPIKGARVALVMVKDRQREVSVTSGENGEFAFQGIPAGKYELKVTDHGTTQLYQGSENYSTAIVAGPGFDSEHIVFPLEASARLSGTIVDQDDDPVPNATVHLFERSVVLGRNETHSVNQTQTDSLGAFHFAHLSPGTYYVAISARPWYAQPMFHFPNQPELHSDLDLAFPLTYYSGATSAEGASPLKLDEGAKTQIQITLHAVPSLHVSIEGMNPAEPRTIAVTQPGPGGVPINSFSMQNNGEITGIAPGNYDISFQSFGEGRVHVNERQSVSLSGDTAIHLGGGSNTSIRGKIIMDSDTPPGLIVGLLNQANRQYYSESIQPDGSFEIHNAPAGRYALHFGNAQGTFPAKVEVKGAPFDNGDLEIPVAGQVELAITPGHGFTQVNGTVVRDKKPISAAMVLLIPQDMHHGRVIIRDQSDADGTFSLLFVAPGRYTLIAIDDGHNLAYAEPGVMEPYLPHGRTIDVPVAKDANIEIEVQHRLQ